ncbi:gamma-glutamylcyclotransferase family protein [Streptomyces asoensis]|uniref:gamma-glutamylcyclotransferase family protein n=1 Tax=Streptomyces asoensis TaxID=249586 RepID=UPI0034051C8C
MSAPGLPFFVYGTLRPGEVNHGLLLRGRTLREEPARLTGAVLYRGPGYPYAVEEPGGTVTGEIVTPLPGAYARLLAELDRLEEYAPGDPHNLYERVAREVEVMPAHPVAGRDAPRRAAVLGGPAPRPARDRVLVRAWVYVAAPAVAARLRTEGEPIADGTWHTRP